MFTNILEKRGKEFSTLVKIGDLLGRSLRENVELFSIEDGKVTYVTESNKIVRASYSIKTPIRLFNVEVGTADVFNTKEAFQKVTEARVGKLISDLMFNDYENAEVKFEDVLDLWTTRLEFNRTQAKLQEKVERFGEQTKIISSEEFSKLSQVKKDLVKFLKENAKIINVPEVRNSVKLAAVVSKSFNLPKLTYEKLAESKEFKPRSKTNDTLYEHICQQELINKELKEARINFENIWANNQNVADLASMIYEKDSKKVLTKLAEVVSEVPYFAIASKSQINGLITNSLNLADLPVNAKDVTAFVSSIYESKKPVRKYVINLLNEKYGININNLTETPTFSNLIKTEILIFETLSRLTPKGSIVKDVLSEMAQSLKIKNGVEAIDLMDFINSVFNEAKYTNSLNETNLLQYLDFTRVADDLGKIGGVLKMLQPMLGGGAGGMPGQSPMGGAAPSIGGAPGQPAPSPDLLGGGMGGGAPMPAPNPLAKEGQYDESPMTPEEGGNGGDGTPMGQGSPEDAAMAAQADMGADAEGNHLEPDGDEGLGGQEPQMAGAEGLDIDNPAPEELGVDPMAAGGGMQAPEGTIQLPQEQVLGLLSQLQAILGNAVAGGESITPEGSVEGGVPLEGEPEAPVEGSEMPPAPMEGGEEGGAPEEGGESAPDDEPEYEDDETGEVIPKPSRNKKK